MRCLLGEVQLHIDFLSPEQVLEYRGFSLPQNYIKYDSLYNQNWIHLTNDDYTNDAFVYVMPGEIHDIPNGLWVSVFEVRNKGNGFGSECLDYIKELARGLNKNAVALHALDDSVQHFYIKNGFEPFDSNGNMIFNIFY